MIVTEVNFPGNAFGNVFGNDLETLNLYNGLYLAGLLLATSDTLKVSRGLIL